MVKQTREQKARTARHKEFNSRNANALRNQFIEYGSRNEYIDVDERDEPLPEITDPNILYVYNKVKAMVIGKNLDVRQLTLMVPLTMQICKDLTEMSGAQKKQLTQQVLKQLVEEMSFETYEQKLSALSFIENDLNDLIDTVYAASIGKFEFGSETDVPYNEEQFNTVYNQLKGMVIGKKITTPMLIVLIPSAMVSVATFAKISGQQRRMLVIRLIERLIDEYDTTDADGREDTAAVLVKTFVRDQVPLIIDTIYAASKGKYVFKQIQSKLSKIFGCCAAKKSA